MVDVLTLMLLVNVAWSTRAARQVSVVHPLTSVDEAVVIAKPAEGLELEALPSAPLWQFMQEKVFAESVTAFKCLTEVLTSLAPSSA